jgi:hypothetical protein
MHVPPQSSQVFDRRMARPNGGLSKYGHAQENLHAAVIAGQWLTSPASIAFSKVSGEVLEEKKYKGNNIGSMNAQYRWYELQHVVD